MNIGFTGTRKGMSEEQKKMVEEVLLDFAKGLTFLVVHHGACLGADYDFHMIARKIDIIDILVYIYPGQHGYRKDLFLGANKIYKEKPYLERNQDIVNNSDFLIACPDGMEKLRSGTWSTIRRAKKQKIHTLIIYPNGDIDKCYINKNTLINIFPNANCWCE